MSRSRFQIALVLALLPLGIGLCVHCLGEESSPSAPASAHPPSQQVASTAAAIAIAPAPARALDEVPRAAPRTQHSAPDPHQGAPLGATAEGEKLAQASPEKRRREPANSLAASPASAAPQQPRLSPALRLALLERVADRSQGERARLAAIVALAADGAGGAGGYVPEVFRARFPDQAETEVAPGPIADFETRRILSAALRAPGTTVAERAVLVAALGPSQGYPEIGQALQEAFSDPSPEVRGQVVLELAASEEPGTQDLLQQAALDPSLEVRVRAVLVLGADPAQQPALEAAYDAEGQAPEVKAAIVVQTSEHASTPGGADFLTRVLRDETDPGLRAEALAALAVAAEVDPAGLRAAIGPELPPLLESARAQAGVSASADAETVLEVLRAG